MGDPIDFTIGKCWFSCTGSGGIIGHIDDFSVDLSFRIAGIDDRLEVFEVAQFNRANLIGGFCQVGKSAEHIEETWIGFKLIHGHFKLFLQFRRQIVDVIVALSIMNHVELGERLRLIGFGKVFIRSVLGFHGL